MTHAQHTVLEYIDVMNVGAMFLNTPTIRRWVWKEDIRNDAMLADITRDAIFMGPWRARLTEPINNSDKLGWYR